MKNLYLRFMMLALFASSSYFLSAQCNDTTVYIQQTICQGQPYNFNGVSLDSAGTYNDTTVVAGGCDSIVSLQLFVIPILYTNIYDTMCAGGSYTWNGHTYTTAGIYGDTLYYGANFCDSITLLNLAIGTGHNDTFRISAYYCNTGGGRGTGYNFYGTLENRSGVYTHSSPFTNGNSCSDSIIILTLTVSPAPTVIGVAPGGGGGGFGGGTPDTIRTCSSSYDFFGRTLTADGNYGDTILSSHGCDSVYEYITLVLNSGYNSSTIAGTSCAGAPFVWRGNSYPGPGGGGAGGGRPVTYYDTVVVAGGCDTIYTITVSNGIPVRPVTRVDSFCAGSSYVYGSYTFTTSGLDTLTIPSNTGGCDSTIYLHLTYKSAPTFTWIDSFCDGSTYTYRGHSYIDSGVHFFTEPAAVGCDSIIRVVLSYKSAPTITIVDSFCQGTSYTYRGVTYTTAGVHPITITAPTGCDSVINLSLSYTVPPSATIAATICQGTYYYYGADSFNTRGNHTFLVSHAGQCDSSITVNLTITPAPRGFVIDSFCAGTTFHYGTDSFTAAGTYNVLVPSPVGCDSNITLILTNKAAPAIPTITQAANVLVVNPLAANIQWYLNGSPIAGATSQTYIATQSGIYTVSIHATGGCVSTSANDTLTGVGINEVSGSDMFKLYPNPNNGKFTIETTQFSGAEITVYDVLGRPVYQKQLVSSMESIDMSGATNGTYYLVIKNQQYTRYAHFVLAQ